jgi:hypothetical protein
MRRDKLFLFAAGLCGSREALVVKMSDTSHPGKVGSNPALGVTYRGGGPAGLSSRGFDHLERDDLR